MDGKSKSERRTGKWVIGKRGYRKYRREKELKEKETKQKQGEERHKIKTLCSVTTQRYQHTNHQFRHLYPKHTNPPRFIMCFEIRSRNMVIHTFETLDG